MPCVAIRNPEISPPEGGRNVGDHAELRDSL
jgi:hypothetical protein